MASRFAREALAWASALSGVRSAAACAASALIFAACACTIRPVTPLPTSCRRTRIARPELRDGVSGLFAGGSRSWPSVALRPSVPPRHAAPKFPREFLDLPSQIAHRPKPRLRLLRVEAVPVVAVAFALKGRQHRMHSHASTAAGRAPPATGKAAHCASWRRSGGLGATSAALHCAKWRIADSSRASRHFRDVPIFPSLYRPNRRLDNPSRPELAFLKDLFFFLVAASKRFGDVEREIHLVWVDEADELSPLHYCIRVGPGNNNRCV